MINVLVLFPLCCSLTKLREITSLKANLSAVSARDEAQQQTIKDLHRTIENLELSEDKCQKDIASLRNLTRAQQRTIEDLKQTANQTQQVIQAMQLKESDYEKTIDTQ